MKTISPCLDLTINIGILSKDLVAKSRKDLHPARQQILACNRKSHVTSTTRMKNTPQIVRCALHNNCLRHRYLHYFTRNHNFHLIHKYLRDHTKTIPVRSYITCISAIHSDFRSFLYHAKYFSDNPKTSIKHLSHISLVAAIGTLSVNLSAIIHYNRAV